MIPPRLTTGAYVCPNFPAIRTQDEIMTYRIIYSPDYDFKANRSSNSLIFFNIILTFLYLSLDKPLIELYYIITERETEGKQK